MGQRAGALVHPPLQRRAILREDCLGTLDFGYVVERQQHVAARDLAARYRQYPAVSAHDLAGHRDFPDVANPGGGKQRGMIAAHCHGFDRYAHQRQVLRVPHDQARHCP